MAYKINTTGVQSSDGSNFEPIPDGQYLVQIVDFKERQTKNGDPMIAAQMEIVDGDHQGRVIFDNIIIPLGPESKAWGIMGRTKHFLHCIGEPHEGEIDIDPEAWIGRRVKIESHQETYFSTAKNKDVTNAKVKNYILDETVTPSTATAGAATSEAVAWDE
jgi:hypothetical protein